MSKLAEIIAEMEGFYKPGSRPNRNHNPGDLRHAPHVLKQDEAGIGVEPDDASGWADLEHQIKLDAARGLTLAEFINKFAPPVENNTSNYLHFVATKLNVSPDTPLSNIA